MSQKISDLQPGTRFRITGFRSNTDYEAQLRRLGMVPGTQVTLLRRAPLGDPVEVRLRGYSLALRPSEADEVAIEVLR